MQVTTHNRRIIAFCGPFGAGKDTAAKGLLSKTFPRSGEHPLAEPYYPFVHHNFADSLKEACQIQFGLTDYQIHDPAGKMEHNLAWGCLNRQVMTTYAKALRAAFGGGVFAHRWNMLYSGRIGSKQCAVVTDLRHEEEFKMLQSMGAKVVYILNDKTEAKRQAGIAAGEQVWLDQSESYLDFLRQSADLIVKNNGTPEDLQALVIDKATEWFGEPSQW